MEPRVDAEGPVTAAVLQAEGRALRALARSLVGVDAVDDVLQDAAAAALAGSTSTRGRLGAWLAGTVRNLARMRRRSARRRTAHERLAAAAPVDLDSDPAAIAAAAELAADLGAAVQALAEPFRTVVVLRYWRGLGPEAIAAELGVPRNTVRSRLQRGLASLRAALDGRYGQRARWRAPMLVFADWRAAPAAVSPGGLLLCGGLMKLKLLVGAVAVAVVATAAAFWFAGHDAVPPATGDAATGAAVTSVAAAPDPLQRAPVVPAAAPEQAKRSGIPPSGDTVAGPWLASLLVVDEDDEPVADAVIELQADGDGRGDPAIVLRSDRTGAATATVPRAAYQAIGRKDGLRSGRVHLARAQAAPVHIVLQVPVLLRGRVLAQDGSPAGGAKVTATVDGFSSAERSRPVAPEPVLADAEGRFTIELQADGAYALRAEWNGQRSFAESVWLHGPPPEELLLAMPGAITLSGVVVAPDGTPVAGADVQAWREWHAPPPNQRGEDGERVRTKADAAGHFVLQVRRHARYQLLADDEVHAPNAVVWAEPTPARPHAEVRLQLLPFAAIAGRVLHADGRPFPGVFVRATAEAGARLGHGGLPGREQQFGEVQAVRSGEDGSFTLRVHPGTTWSLFAAPVPTNWRLGKHERVVAPGRQDVVLALTDDDVSGVPVRGHVRWPAGGVPGCYTLELVDCGEDGAALYHSEAQAAIDGDRFTLAPLPVGGKFALQVWPQDKPGMQYRFSSPFAVARSEVFTVRPDLPELELPIVAWGQVAVAVTTAEGQPVRRAQVLVQAPANLGYVQGALPVDREGRAVFPRVVPGSNRLTVFLGQRVLHEQQLLVSPGLNPEQRLRLPALPAAGTGR